MILSILFVEISSPVVLNISFVVLCRCCKLRLLFFYSNWNWSPIRHGCCRHQLSFQLRWERCLPKINLNICLAHWTHWTTTLLSDCFQKPRPWVKCKLIPLKSAHSLFAFAKGHCKRSSFIVRFDSFILFYKLELMLHTAAIRIDIGRHATAYCHTMLFSISLAVESFREHNMLGLRVYVYPCIDLIHFLFSATGSCELVLLQL